MGIERSNAERTTMTSPRSTQGSPQRVTILDVARRAAVSRQTVSNVLTHPSRVRPDTLDRVRAAIDDLGYQPSSSAQSLRSQRAGAIGVEVNTLGPRSHNETMAPFLASLGMRAGTHGAHVVPFGSPEDSPMLQGYREMWARRLVDAFVVADTHHGDARPPWLEENGIPYASFGRVWDDPSFTCWVDVDGAAGTRAAVAHCADAGYRTVAFLGWPRGSVVGDDRRLGWAQGCADAGSAGGSVGIAGPEATATQDLDDARRAARRLLSDLGPGDAVVCASDVLALGVHHELLTAGLRPGADVGVVGFDGSENAVMHHLTTVAQPLDGIAEQVLALLDDAMAGRPQPGAGVLLEPSLSTDRSTASGAATP
jgi:DNA-binding LacI/PurR family transcriptional regulator